MGILRADENHAHARAHKSVETLGKKPEAGPGVFSYDPQGADVYLGPIIATDSFLSALPETAGEGLSE